MLTLKTLLPQCQQVVKDQRSHEKKRHFWSRKLNDFAKHYSSKQGSPIFFTTLPLLEKSWNIFHLTRAKTQWIQTPHWTQALLYFFAPFWLKLHLDKVQQNLNWEFKSHLWCVHVHWTRWMPHGWVFTSLNQRSVTVHFELRVFLVNFQPTADELQPTFLVFLAAKSSTLR